MKANSNFTRLGFSRKGFGCCGHWTACDLGKGTCHYDELDPEVKDYCSAYKKARAPKLEVTTIPTIEETNNESQEFGQLSLFI